MSCTKDWIAVFKVKDTEKVQHFIEFELRFLCTTDLSAIWLGMLLLCY